jgi:hypothetical protein
MKYQKDHNNLIFENRIVSVRKIRMNTGDSILFHSGRERIMFAVSPLHVRIMELPAARDLVMEKEAVCWHDHSDFTVQNLSNDPAEIVVFSITANSQQEYSEEPLRHFIDQLRLQDIQIHIDNPAIQVLKIKLKPKGHLPSHPGVNVILFALSPYTIRYYHENLGEISKTVKVGDVLFHGSEVSAIENLGQNYLSFLVLVLKVPSLESISL